MKTGTTRCLLLSLFLLASTTAFAQTEELGDEFIFFVNGTNILIPNSDAQAVADPADPSSDNRVARFNAGAWSHAGWSWGRTEGVDATASVGETYGESDTLYFKIMSDPANATQSGISIMLSDKTDDSSANDGTADLEFRLIWPLPAWIHDGEWHDLAIPLPPATRAALEDAKAGGEIDTLAAMWDYPGAWSSGGFGVGPGFGTNTEDPLWSEFEWDALYRVGPFWDNASGGGPIYMDDVYIGGPSTDISTATGAPSAMSGVTFEADGSENVISWTPNPEFSGYNVYASLSPITDVTADNVVQFGTLSFEDELEFRHRYEIPHPSLGAQPLYYAVTSLSAFGVENPDVSASSGEIVNPNLPQKAYIREITDQQATDMFLAIADDIVTDEYFADNHPVFVVDSTHRSPGDGTAVANMPTDEDNSARFLIGYTQLNELFIYGEITDDQVTFAPASVTGADTWNYDSAEIVFGHYDVRDTEGGSILVGSSHQDMQRGEEPDYGIRIAGLGNPQGLARTSTWVGWSIDVDFESATAIEVTDTGWKFLTLLPLDQIQNTDQSDAVMAPPATDEVAYLPFIISLNDADGGQRQTQVVWSIKPNVTGQWWNTPAQWETVAMAGLNVEGTSSEDPTTPAFGGFALAQSTPNPAADVAQIGFKLGAPSQARVEVFNMLGQRVAVLADRHFAAGEHTVAFDTAPHASGVYVYRLSAGDFVATKRMAIIR